LFASRPRSRVVFYCPSYALAMKMLRTEGQHTDVYQCDAFERHIRATWVSQNRITDVSFRPLQRRDMDRMEWTLNKRLMPGGHEPSC